MHQLVPDQIQNFQKRLKAPENSAKRLDRSAVGLAADWRLQLQSMLSDGSAAVRPTSITM